MLELNSVVYTYKLHTRYSLPELVFWDSKDSDSDMTHGGNIVHVVVISEGIMQDEIWFCVNEEFVPDFKKPAHVSIS